MLTSSPVSYTHLDVYKRQVVCKILNLDPKEIDMTEWTEMLDRVCLLYTSSEDGCDGGACDAHIENENENGVKYDIRERAAQLHRHSQSGFTRSTEAAFFYEEEELTEGNDKTDSEVYFSHFANLFVLGAGIEVKSRD